MRVCLAELRPITCGSSDCPLTFAFDGPYFDLLRRLLWQRLQRFLKPGLRSLAFDPDPSGLRHSFNNLDTPVLYYNSEALSLKLSFGECQLDITHGSLDPFCSLRFTAIKRDPIQPSEARPASHGDTRCDFLKVFVATDKNIAVTISDRGN